MGLLRAVKSVAGKGKQLAGKAKHAAGAIKDIIGGGLNAAKDLGGRLPKLPPFNKSLPPPSSQEAEYTLPTSISLDSQADIKAIFPTGRPRSPSPEPYVPLWSPSEEKDKEPWGITASPKKGWTRKSAK